MPKPVRSKNNNKKKKNNKTSIEKEFDKFRHDIYKFGLSGLDKKDQLDARVELAIKLGAKPKKWIKPNTGLGSDNKKVKDKSIGIQDGKIGKTNQYTKTNPASSTRTSQRSHK